MRVFLLYLFASLGCALFAREVTMAEATQVASAWAKRNSVFAGETSQIQTPIPVTDANGTLLYYKVMLGARGMVIVSGDTHLDPVIAALPEATSPEIPEGHPLAALLLEDISQRRTALVTSTAKLRTVSTAVEEAVERNTARWDELLGSGGGLQTFALNAVGAPARVYAYPKPWSTRQITHWNQTSSNEYVTLAEHTLYNMYLPGLNGPSMYAGCVAIAGSAILEFFQVPEGPTGIPCKYQLNYVENEIVTLGGKFDWSLLPEWRKGVTLSDDARKLLATVAADVGVLVGTNYKNDGSAATPSELAVALGHFGFTNASYTETRDIAACVYPQVRAGAPVYLAIKDTSDGGGHAVVAVGYGEDDGNQPYTRLFMGWGGQHDAWYALPTISQPEAFSYEAIVGVVTAISRDENVLAICGRVTNTDGLGVPYEPVTITFQPQGAEAQEVRTLATGLHGEYATRLPFSTWYTIKVGEETKTILNVEYPTAIDFEIEREDVPQVYTDVQDALDVAIQEGKLLFVLSGTAWDEACTDIKKALVALGSTFADDFVLVYNDNDYGASTMNLGAPGYATFEPRAFGVAQGATGNTALATGRSVEELQAVLEASLEQWSASVVKQVEIVGETIVVGGGSYSLRVTYGDGLVLTPSEVTWSVLSETAAITGEGELTATAAETVTLQASVTLDGNTYTATLDVRTVAVDEVESVAITGVEGDTIVLEDTPHPDFSCMVTLTDGTSFEIRPEWSVSESTEWYYPTIDATSGVVTCAKVFTREDENHRLIVAATYPGLTIPSREFALYGYTWMGVEAWTIWPKEVYPGAIVSIVVSSLSYIEAGKKTTATDTSLAEYQLTTSDAVAYSLETMEIAIPLGATSGAKTFTLKARKKGSRHGAYSAGKSDQMGVYPLERTTVEETRGGMPHGWLQYYFNELATASDIVLKADEDTDGDGYKNWQEYVLGTDPTDKTSALQLHLHVPADGSAATVTWDKHPGRTYQLLGAATLNGPWTTPDSTSRFFKLHVEAE